MLGNRCSCPGVWDEVSGDPRDMAKAGLPEFQSPGGAKDRPPERRLKPVPSPAAGSSSTCGNPPGKGAMSSEDIQGDEWNV
jgi:hypothetical protein